MTENDFELLLERIRKTKAETATLELKTADHGCPGRLYDTLSSFSNSDDGGIIVFGISEKDGFAEVGVYDSHDLVKHVTEQCGQMTPVVRPVFTTLEKDGKTFVAAEIKSLDITDRPCFYAGKGRLKGSYVRVGDADEMMTEYEVYSYEAFRRKYRADTRPVEKAAVDMLDPAAVDRYLNRVKSGRPHLSALSDERILAMMGMLTEGVPTLAAVMLFGIYPQAYFPQCCILAVSVPGDEVGSISEAGERFLDNQRIQGTLREMLAAALAFVKRNSKTGTVIDPITAKRRDREDYPQEAVREALLNALIHRDYSVHAEGKPIQLQIYPDRLEIRSPGGLYGNLRIDQLGKVQADTRNPTIAFTMEMHAETENRYSGIPTIRRVLAEQGLPEAEFADERGTFVVRFRLPSGTENTAPASPDADLLSFCRTPRTRKEIADFLRFGNTSYAIRHYVKPLLESGQLLLTLPAQPASRRQKYVTAGR